MAEKKTKIPHPGDEKEQEWRKLLAEGQALWFPGGVHVSSLRELAGHVEGIEAPEEPEPEKVETASEPTQAGESLSGYERFLEVTEDGQVRTLLVGPLRDEAADDAQVAEGAFFSLDKWEEQIVPKLKRVDELESEVNGLRTQLESKAAAAGLPPDLKTRLVAVRGVGESLADLIIDALVKPQAG